MSEATAVRIDGVVESTNDADYAACGFHHKHTATLQAIPEFVRAFIDAGYILEMMTCEDLRATTEKMRLCYSFNRFEAVDRHAVFVEVDPDTQEPPTVSAIVGAANWFEREVYDMYGVRFADHPYLVRILLPEDADFFALRKDFGQMGATGGDDGEASDD